MFESIIIKIQKLTDAQFIGLLFALFVVQLVLPMFLFPVHNNESQFGSTIANRLTTNRPVILEENVIASNNPELCLQTNNVTSCYLNYLSHLDIQQACKIDPGFNSIAGTACTLQLLKISDYETCSKVYSQDPYLCWELLGEIKNDTSLCDKAKSAIPLQGGETRDYRPMCYFDLARKGVIGITDCNRLGVDYIGCYSQVAIKSKNATICYALDNVTGRNCIEQVALATLDLRMCNEILNFSGYGGDQGYSCRSNIRNRLTPADYTEDTCEFIGDACWYELALRNINQTLCNQIADANSKQQCLLRLQKTT